MSRAGTPSQETQQAALLKAQRLFGHRKDFTGADIGFRWTDGKLTDQLAIRVHVKLKIPEAELGDATVLPKDINGIPLDVIEGDYGLPENAGTAPLGHRSRMPFLIGGGSCGRMDNSAGTIGLLVLHRTQRWPGLLSNWHVLAGPRARVGDPILHPGLSDTPGGAQSRPIARLSSWMLDRQGDAAVARLEPETIWVPLLLGMFREIRETRAPVLGEILVKSGRKTGVTHARVDGLGAYRVEYEVRPGRWEFRDIEGFKLVPEKPGNPGGLQLSAPGDSGGCWVAVKDGAAVGLHFAGERIPNPAAEHAIACPINPVLDRLNVDVATFDDLYDRLDQTPVAGAKLTTRPGGPNLEEPSSSEWATALPLSRLSAEDFNRDTNRSRLAKLQSIFDMMLAALSAYFRTPVRFPITNKISGLVAGPGDPYSVISRAVNEYPPFENVLAAGVGLTRPIASYEIAGCKTYLQACTVILSIIEGHPS